MQLPEFDDEVTLQINGVPVLVNPESMLDTNTMAGARIFAKGTLDIGADEVTAVGTKAEGVPVLVNPESMLESNTMAGVRVFGKGTLDIGADEVTVLQVNGVPVLVNPESMLEENTMAASRIFPKGTLDIGADEVSVAQKEPKNTMVMQMTDGSEIEVVGSEIMAQVPIEE